MKNFLNRTLVGAVLVCIVAVTIFGQRESVFIAALLLTTLALQELFNALRGEHFTRELLFAVLVNFGIMYFAYERNAMGVASMLFLSAFILFIWFTFEAEKKLEDVFFNLFAIFYISFFFSFVFYFPKEHQNYLILIYFASWGTDSFAYLTGMLIGKTPLVPSISPKKTVEGAAGGLLGAILLGLISRPYLFPEISYIAMVFIMFLGSIVSQMGDFFASRIKRVSGIKDFSNLLIGHGGILDRFDSVLFATPMIWLLIKILVINQNLFMFEL